MILKTITHPKRKRIGIPNSVFVLKMLSYNPIFCRYLQAQ